ncbi:MAG TPA: hypothetical protein VHQ22_00675 [Terriglobales bacterium]|jgi:hypothetical protein|nr:hypothetical protein [Terriglobales bacterium]
MLRGAVKLIVPARSSARDYRLEEISFVRSDKNQMAERKFLSEFALNMLASQKLLIQQEDLPGLVGADIFDENPCHIYMICRRPRISLNPAGFKVTDLEITGELRVQRGYEFDSHQFSLRNHLGTSELSLDCPFPHNFIRLRNKSGEILSGIKSAILALQVESLRRDLDLEVLYIGQSYGVEGARTAPDRLRSHSTLQGIYAEALHNSPDMEIWLLLLSFHAPLLLACFDGRSKEYGTTFEEDTAHMERVLSTDITEQQQINFTEAALIRYFKPAYNTIYKDRFPNPAHQTYSECYDLDLNAVCVEIQTDDMGFSLWSKAVPKNWVHLAQFALHSPEERKGIFEL